MVNKTGLFPNGLPFRDELKASLDKIKDRVFNRNKAALIIIDGGVGEGKTTLGVHIADYIQGKVIKLDESYAMGGQEFQDKLITSYNLKKNQVIYDEAGDFAKHQAITSFNQQLNRVFETYRAFKAVVILILPNMEVLDNRLFDLRIPRLLIHVNKRSNTRGNYSVYSLYRMFMLKELMKKLKIKPMAYNMITPNYRGNFYNLPKDRAAELDKRSIKGKLDIVNKGALKGQGLMGLRETAKQLDVGVPKFYQIIRELNIKPDTYYKNRHYYGSETRDRIRRFLETGQDG